MRKLKLFMTALALTGGVNVALAQTDVTSTYITNAGFDTSADFQTTNFGAGEPKAVTGWTAKRNSTAYTWGGAIGFGNTGGQINGASLPSTNSDDTNTGGALCLTGGWNDNNGYISYEQEITLPAGKYTITIPVNNVGQNAQYRSDNNAGKPNLFNFTTSDAVYTGTVTSFPVNTWTTNTINFSLAKETTGTLSVGLRWNNTGSGNTAKLVIDYVKAMYSNYTETLQSTIDRATVLNARAEDTDLTAAINTAQGVLTGANNTVAYQVTIDDAVTTLRAAISTAQAKVVLLEGENITFILENADFESSTPVTGGITTYDYDAAANTTSFSRMQIVEGWTIAENGNAKSAGVFKFGENPFLGSTGTSYQAPASGSATGEDKALGIVAVWSSSAQYKQNVTLPAGSYIIEVPVYNTAGTTAFSKNLIGFVENGGTEHLATAKTYATGSWITEKVIFELENETSGYMSLGYTSANQGSGAMPHLFIDNVKVTYTSPIAAAYQKYQVARQAAQAAIDNTDYNNVTGEERTTLQNAIDATPEATKEGYNDAADALDEAREAFTAAKSAYDSFVAAKATTVPELAYAATAKKTALEEAIAATATSAEEATDKATAITTALRAYYESNAKAEGVEGAVDYSSAIAAANADTNTGWTNGVGTNQGQGYTDSEGTVAAKYLDGGWAPNAACNVDMTRTVEVPAGKYLLTVKARGAVDLTVYTLSIAGKTINLPHSNGGSNGVFGNGWDDASVEFESDGKAQTLEVIAKSTANQQWFSMNDFRLVRLELYTEMADAADYAAMTAALEAAEAKTLGFAANEYAPYNNVEAIKAIATAKAIDTAAENAKADIEDITTALGKWTANETDLDAIYDGDLANAPIQATSENVVLDGWVTKSGNIRQTFKGNGENGKACLGADEVGVFVHPGEYNYGETTGYTMPLKAETWYVASAKYCAWANNSNNDFTLTITKEGENVASKSYGANATACTEANALKEVKLYFKTTDAADYVLSVNANGNTFMTGFHLTEAVAEEVTIEEGANEAPAANDFANVTLIRTLKAGIWNTFSVPFDMEIPDEWTVKEFTGATDNTLNFTDANNIVAGKPYLVKTSEDFENPTFKGVAVQATEGETVGEGDYKFAAQIYNKELATDGTVAYLATDGTIKKLTSGGIKGLRAYFIIPANADPEAPARIAFVDEGGTTAIESVASETVNAENGIYDLQGRRVNAAKKGLYIINGKKVVK